MKNTVRFFCSVLLVLRNVAAGDVAKTAAPYPAPLHHEESLTPIPILASSKQASSAIKKHKFKFIWDNSTGGNLIVTEYPPGDEHGTGDARFVDVVVSLFYPPIKSPSERRDHPEFAGMGLRFIYYKDFKFVARDQRGAVIEARPRYPENEFFGMQGMGRSFESRGNFLLSLDKDQKLSEISLAYGQDKVTISLSSEKAP